MHVNGHMIANPVSVSFNWPDGFTGYKKLYIWRGLKTDRNITIFSNGGEIQGIAVYDLYISTSTV